MFGNERVLAFLQSASGSRFGLRDTCVRPPEAPALFGMWFGKARLIAADTRKSATPATTNTAAPPPPKAEKWRITPVLPNRGHNTGATDAAAENNWPPPPTWEELKARAARNKHHTSNPNAEAETMDPLPPRLPAPWDPSVWPTLDRIIHPWEAPLSPVEYAVTHFLAEKHPEIHGHLIDFALRYAGIIPDEDNITGNKPDNAPGQPGATTTEAKENQRP